FCIQFNFAPVVPDFLRCGKIKKHMKNMLSLAGWGMLECLKLIIARIQLFLKCQVINAMVGCVQFLQIFAFL
nr:hypothetical protein [Petrimonas sp.]